MKYLFCFLILFLLIGCARPIRLTADEEALFTRVSHSEDIIKVMKASARKCEAHGNTLKEASIIITPNYKKNTFYVSFQAACK